MTNYTMKNFTSTEIPLSQFFNFEQKAGKNAWNFDYSSVLATCGEFLQLFFISKLKSKFQACKMFFTSAESTFNPIYVKDFQLVPFNDTNGASFLNSSGTLLVDFNQALVPFVLKTKVNVNDQEFNKIIFRGKIDTCKVADGVFGNFLVRFLMENLEKFSNLTLACPHKKNFYYAHNLPALDDSFIPGFFPRNRFQWQITITVNAKVKKTFVQIMSIRLYGIKLA